MIRLIISILIFFVAGCAHTDVRNPMDDSGLAGHWYSGSVAERNLLRSAVYTNGDAKGAGSR